MAVNYANKFSPKVDERFKLKSKTAMLKGAEGYDWKGVNTVTVYAIPTVGMNDYTASGASRYGTPSELDNTTQDLTVTKDRSFTFTIDKKNKQDTMGVMGASKALKRQVDEVIVPEVDTYRFSVLGANAGTTSSATPITSSNAFTELQAADTALDNAKIPEEGRLLFCTPEYLNMIMLDGNFTKASEIAQSLLMKGQIGEINGNRVFKIINPYLPANTDFIICHKTSLITVQKLEDYKIHDNPPGINGQLVEGRIRYDAFVLENKKPSIYRHRNA